MARILTISDEITMKSINDVIKDLQNYILNDNKQDETQKDYKREPIHIMIDSNGGDGYCGLGLTTMIKSSKTPIYTYCVGRAMSAGLLIFLGGHKRYCYTGSTFLYHQLYHYTGDKLNNLNRTLEWDNKLQERVDNFVMENTKITKKQINEVNERNHDWYIDAEEALELGIIDEILQ